MTIAQYAKNVSRKDINDIRRESNEKVIKGYLQKLIGTKSKLSKLRMRKMINFYQNYEFYYEMPVDKQDKQGNVTTEMKMVPNKLPTATQLAKAIGVTLATLWNWKAEYPYLFETLNKYRGILTEEMVVQFGLTGQYNASFAKFYAINKLGYQDKIDINTSKTERNEQVNIQINNYLSKPAKTGDKQLLPQSETPGELPAFKID
ncbi:MAG: hypothetical protein GY861_03800 [bacterium]|nr:hypothetical protein [bacterium]